MKIHIEISDEQRKKLEKLKNKENRSMQFLVTKAIENFLKAKKIISLMLLAVFLATPVLAYTNDKIADAIYKAENSKAHPYGIMVKYKTTTPRQACLNTIAHAQRDWSGVGDFIEFLGSRYAPIGAENDPTNLNKNWVGNVRYFLEKGGL